MRLFAGLYNRTLKLSKKRAAPRYLFGLSFIESFVFPIPTDFMLAPMALAQRHRAWYFALIATFGSVCGAIVGYLIGLHLYEQVGLPLVKFYNAEQTITNIERWFDIYGIWIIVIAGFTPVPYKLFTISAGAMGMGLAPFILASIIGRAARFYLLSGVIFWGGERLAQLLRKYADIIGWSVVALLILIYLIFRM